MQTTHINMGHESAQSHLRQYQNSMFLVCMKCRALILLRYWRCSTRPMHSYLDLLHYIQNLLEKTPWWNLTSHFFSSAQAQLLHSETLGPPLTASVAPRHQIAYVSHEARRAAAPSTVASWESDVQPRTTDPPPHLRSHMMQHRSHSHAAVGQPTSSPNSPPSSHAGKQIHQTWHFEG